MLKHNIKTQRQRFEKYKKSKAVDISRNNSVKFLKLRKKLRPIVRLILYIRRKLFGFEVEFIHNKIRKTNRPIVFAVTHIGKYDFEIINEVIKQHFYIIAADFININKGVNGILMALNGVVWIDVKDKKDRENSRLMLIEVLKKGGNIMIFPEGTWNLSENEIVYDIWFGAVDIALESNAIIIPVALEQYEKKFVINIGKEYDPKKVLRRYTRKSYTELSELKLKIKKAGTQRLRDVLATLKYDIWESHGVEMRNEISYDYWTKFLQTRIKEWPGYKLSEQTDNCYIPKEKQEYWKLMDDLGKIKVKKENEFLFKKVAEQ